MADVFRKDYVVLSDDQKIAIADIKDKAEELYALFAKQTPSREIAVAKTELETSVMWAIKAITV